MKVKTINLKDQTITIGPRIHTILSKVHKYTNYHLKYNCICS